MSLEKLPTTKKIWFTQFGYPSIKNCEFDPKYSKDNILDRNKIIDFDEQEGALLKNYDLWSKNPKIELISLYYYDANPNIHLPEYGDPNWAFNHSLNFKSTNIGVSQIMEDLLKDFPERENIELDLYNQTFQGAIINWIYIIKLFRGRLLRVLKTTMNFCKPYQSP